jgi:eukaryotic-like serine/threonine-protein kinase
MLAYDPTDIVRECVSCRRCYPKNTQFCRDCLVELVSVETIPHIINGRYRLERIISYGGTGIVFAATSLKEGVEFAIKVIRASTLADPRAQDRFSREVYMALQFHHPQIGAVYDFGMLPDASGYIISEYVKGTPLRSEMKRIGKFAAGDAIPIIASVCDALDAAHEAGMVHRDLKPESIILLPEDDGAAPRVKIVDFSFTKIATGKSFVSSMASRLQGQGHLPLSPAYLSPEQYLGTEADPRSDIYSLGVIAFEMLSGQPPFSAKKINEFGQKLLEARPPSLRSLNPDVNIVIEAQISRALEKSPMDRPQRALDFKRGLLNATHFN